MSAQTHLEHVGELSELLLSPGDGTRFAARKSISESRVYLSFKNVMFDSGELVRATALSYLGDIFHRSGLKSKGAFGVHDIQRLGWVW